MPSQLAQRIFQAHLELSYRLGRRVTLSEFGELIAKEMRRKVPFTAAAVSRWENGLQIPSLAVIEAIASVTGLDPGWISHGEKTAAAGPQRGSMPNVGRSEGRIDPADEELAPDEKLAPPVRLRRTGRDAPGRRNRPS